MYTIATLNDLRRHLHLADRDSADDDELMRTLQEASHLIESLTGRRFCPHVETRSISLDPANRRELILPADLLELQAISDGGGPIEIEEIVLLPADRDAPASILRRLDDGPFNTSDGGADAISVSGVWGWHDRWSTAWRDSGDAVGDSALMADASVISVGDAAADQDGGRPRFQIGQLLRIEREYLRVTAIDPARQQLTVRRGVQGSAAGSHRRGSRIQIYSPAPSIRDLTLRYAELMSKSVGLLQAEASPLLERLRRLTA